MFVSTFFSGQFKARAYPSGAPSGVSFLLLCSWPFEQILDQADNLDNSEVKSEIILIFACKASLLCISLLVRIIALLQILFKSENALEK